MCLNVKLFSACTCYAHSIDEFLALEMKIHIPIDSCCEKLLDLVEDITVPIACSMLNYCFAIANRKTR